MDERIIRAKLSHLRQSAVVERRPIEGWEARTADHLAPGAEPTFDAVGRIRLDRLLATGTNSLSIHSSLSAPYTTD